MLRYHPFLDATRNATSPEVALFVVSILHHGLLSGPMNELIKLMGGLSGIVGAAVKNLWSSEMFIDMLFLPCALKAETLRMR